MRDAITLKHDVNNPSPSSRSGVIRDPEGFAFAVVVIAV